MSAAHARTAALRPGAVLSAESTPRARAIPALRAAAPARPACAFVVRPGALARRQAAPGPLSASASPAPAPRPARDAPGASAPSPRSLVVARAAPAAAPAAPEPKSAASGLAFAFTLVCWFAANAVFAIFNKKTLNVFPYPWLLSWIQLACGAVLMLAVWALRVYPAPAMTWPKLRALLPVTALHLVGHVAGCASYNFSSISFMQVVKAAEPVVSVLCLTAFYGQRFSAGVWLSLVPIVAGVAVVSATEVNFAVAGFAAAMVSNLAFVFRNILSKQAQSDIGLEGINLYAWMTLLGTALLLPVSLAVEGGALAGALQSAAAAFPTSGAVPLLWLGKDTPFLAFLLTGGAFYHLYNQFSYMCLSGISPLTYSIANTVKRVVVILAGILVFRNPVTLLNAAASAVAIFGTFLYSQAETAAKKAKAAAAQAA